MMNTMWVGNGAADPGGATHAGPRREFQVEVVTEIDEIDPVEWDKVTSSAGAPVFYSHAYLRAYESDPLTEINAFRYLMVRDSAAGRAVAVVPAFLQQHPDPLGCLRPAYPELDGSAALLSSMWHCYDTHLAGLANLPAADHGRVATATVAALRDQASALGAGWFGLVNVAEGGPTEAALRAAGLPLRYLMDRFVVELTGIADLDEFLSRLARTRARLNLGRTMRRAAEAGVATTVLPVDRADLDETAALCARTAERFGNDGFYPEGTFQRFVAALGPAAHVLEVRQRGRLVAVGVCLVDDQRFHTWTCGVDYAVDGNFSPYLVLFAESVALALRLRRPVFEGGRSNEVFKQRHGLAPRRLRACVVAA